MAEDVKKAEEVKVSEVNYKVGEDFKATLTLFSGKEITIDLMKTSNKEWRSITNPKTTEEEEFAILAKATGLKPEDISNMAQPDYRLIVDAFLRLAVQPLTNPT
ncbi:MAG: phage tail assembly protein [Proteobacteria bacterium]|nr:phage tail assembly protein [Pseudomonadota bacterium]